MSNGRDGKHNGGSAKTSTRHPYAAMEHRVIDAPAYADMSFSAQALLLLMARQLSKDFNNGHLQASFKWCKGYGFGSEHTLRAALAELIGHGFIYRTRSHGANGAWATYAVTWLPITKREGLFLAGFVACAWRKWQPVEKKSSRQKLPDDSGIKCSFIPEHPAESAGKPPAKTAAYVLVPVGGALSTAVATPCTALDLAVDLESRGRSGGAQKKRNPKKSDLQICSECGQPFTAKRTHALPWYAGCCSTGCKTRAYRKRVRLASAPREREEVRSC